MKLKYLSMPTIRAMAPRAGATDAHDMPAERVAGSAGSGTPCRHCLEQVPPGKPYLIAAYRPFDGLNPYTETGPIFLCAEDCIAGTRRDLPRNMLGGGRDYILRGYSSDERIVYGTGCVVPRDDIPARCAEIFADDAATFIHIRFSGTNCFQCRVERGGHG